MPSISKEVDNSRKNRNMTGISKEKLDWMKEVGIKEWEEPMKFYVVNIENNCVYNFSEDFIKETPLPELKERVESFLPFKEEK